MKPFLHAFLIQDSVRHPTARRRVGMALTGVIAALGVSGGVLGLFAQDSPSPWLLDSRAAVAQIEACHRQQAQRAAREACVRQAMPQWPAAEPRQPAVSPTR